jgi:hypothetical protein
MLEFVRETVEHFVPRSYELRKDIRRDQEGRTLPELGRDLPRPIAVGASV